MIQECKKIAALGLCLIAGSAKSRNTVQHVFKPRTKDLIAFGIGTGLDYGGLFGARIVAQPTPHCGIFVGIGTWKTAISWNAGIKIRLLDKPQSSVCPYLMGMYGVNDTIPVSNYYRFYNPDVSNHIKGGSIGAGVDLFNRPRSFGYITLGANYAITPSAIYFTIGLNAVIAKGR